MFGFISQFLNQIFRQFEFFYQVRFFVCRESSVMRFTVFKALEDFTYRLIGSNYTVLYDSFMTLRDHICCEKDRIFEAENRIFSAVRKFLTLRNHQIITSVWLILTGLIWKKVCLPLKNEIKVIICCVIFAISVNYSIKILANEVSHWSNIIWVVLKVSRNSVVNSCADFCAPNVSKPLKAYRRATASNWYDKQVDKPRQTRSKKDYQYVKLYSFTVRFHQKIMAVIALLEPSGTIMPRISATVKSANSS